jgi:hypothetical protein
LSHAWAVGFALGIGLRSEAWGQRILLTKHLRGAHPDPGAGAKGSSRTSITAGRRNFWRPKKRLAGDTARSATAHEVTELRREAGALKEVVAELVLENRLLKKSTLGAGEDGA